MELLQTVLGYLASAARALWTGVLGAVVIGYLGWLVMGFPTMVVGAVLGTLVGTWAGDHLGLFPVRRLTGSRQNDLMLQALGAFVVVGVAWYLYKIAYLLLAVVALGLFAAWFMG